MRMSDTRGLTLLEVLVALVILSLVGLSYLELFHQSHRIADDSRKWSIAVGYAEDAIERVKLQGVPAHPVLEDLPAGFKRQISARLWRPGLTVVEVSVTLPGGGQFDLDRLLQLEPTIARGTTPTEDEGM
jgi:prepilin-type N-terminal cleavage/methylation domain-containing protein